MKLYFECNMGAAGDMLMAALLELLPNRDVFIAKMRALALPGVEISHEPSEKCGIAGTHMIIRISGAEEGGHDIHGHLHEHDHGGTPHSHDHDHGAGDHRHFGYEEIVALITGLDLPENVRDDALAVYKILVEAEMAVHNRPMESVHFHEVGAMDAVVDIVGCCMLISMLGVTEITASPVHVGSGFVKCSHGVLPVPAPATANILRGVPIYSGRVKGELCTPTGAALLRHFVTAFGDMQPMAIRRIGYGMGKKDFKAANCVRAFLYDSGDVQDEIAELSCNLDDMTAEAVGAAVAVLLDAGAPDVFTAPIYMKKSRPAVMLTVLCRTEDESRFSGLMIKHTTTLGVRMKRCRREILHRETVQAETEYGSIRIKVATGYGVVRSKPEYDDVKAAADAHGVPFAQVYGAALMAHSGPQDAKGN